MTPELELAIDEIGVAIAEMMSRIAGRTVSLGSNPLFEEEHYRKIKSLMDQFKDELKKELIVRL